MLFICGSLVYGWLIRPLVIVQTNAKRQQNFVHWTETIKPFSAVCWLYAKYIYENRGVPMGLVETSWGGTNIEAWSSPDSLHACNLSSDEGQKYEL